MVLWSGELTSLRVGALVNATNERLDERNALSTKILDLAGPALKQELRERIKTCRTGEAKATEAYGLPCRTLIHTVGPRYNTRYRTAAESALFNSYRNILHLVRELGLRSVALCAVHTTRRGYPALDGAHIALRTVRRFLERHPDALDYVVFSTRGASGSVYSELTGLYFPRSIEEAFRAMRLLPQNIGNAEGEPVQVERCIRIGAMPGLLMEATWMRRNRMI